MDYVTQHYKPTPGNDDDDDDTEGPRIQPSSTRTTIREYFYNNSSGEGSGLLSCLATFICPCYGSRNIPRDVNVNFRENPGNNDDDGNNVNNEDLTIFIENGERPEGRY